MIVDNIGKGYKNLLSDGFGYVTLQGTLPDPLRGFTLDDWVVKAARVSYRGSSKTKEQDAGLVRRLLTDEHWSPFEMPHLTISFRAPMAQVIHIMRHRTLHINGESSRYKMPKDEFHIPKIWRGQSLTNKQGSEGIVNPPDEFQEKWERHIKAGMEIYNEALGYGVVREQAKYILSTDANYKDYVFTVDLRNFINMVNQRSETPAQQETRSYSNAMFWLVAPMAPFTFTVWKDLAEQDILDNLNKWRSLYGEPTTAEQD